jgi:hypothetical protein
MAGRLSSLGAALLAVAALAACDRKLEPFDPAEEPREPDLSKIFPEGAEAAAPVAPDGSIELPPPPAPAAEPGAAQLAAEPGQPIQGTLRLAAGLENAQPSGAVLFLIARTGAGPPLAVKRIEAPRFPMDFEIGPGDRMLATVPFAGAIQLSARLDSDGNATSRTPGDLTGAAGQAVSPGASGVEIVIDQKL